MATVQSGDGTRISYECVGSGPAVIIADGSLASRTSFPTAAGLADLLAPSYTVYNYDRRGRGESEDGTSPAPQAEVDDLRALIDAAGGSAAIVAFSSGAVLALEAALAGCAISSLVIYEPPFIVSDDRAPLSRDYTAKLWAALAAGDRGEAVALFLGDAIGTSAEQIAGMRQHPSWAEMERAAASLPYDAAVMGEAVYGDPAALDRFAPVAVPTLVLHGGATEPWLAAAARAIAAVLPDARSGVIDGQDHMVAAEAIAPIVCRFLA